MGCKQLGLFNKHIDQITKERDNTPDRQLVWSRVEEIQVGQKVMLQPHWSSLKMAIVTKINEDSINVRLLNGKLLKNVSKGLYYPKLKDLDIDKLYYEAVELLREKKYGELSHNHKSVLKYNAPISVLVEIDNLNQKREHGHIISLEPIFKNRVENYVTDMLPGDLYYTTNWGGKIREFAYKLGQKVIADRYGCVWVGKVIERTPRGEWYKVRSMYHYQKASKSKKIERSEDILCDTGDLNEYSIANLENRLNK